MEHVAMAAMRGTVARVAGEDRRTARSPNAYAGASGQGAGVLAPGAQHETIDSAPVLVSSMAFGLLDDDRRRPRPT